MQVENYHQYGMVMYIELTGEYFPFVGCAHHN